MIIVTKRCFIIAESIAHITIHEEAETYKRRKRINYQISITYVPLVTGTNSNNNRNSGYQECDIHTYDRKVAEGIFANIVKQYREQNPDAIYLDKIAADFLLGSDL